MIERNRAPPPAGSHVRRVAGNHVYRVGQLALSLPISGDFGFGATFHAGVWYYRLDVCFHRLGSVFTAVFTFLEMRHWKELLQGRRLRLAVSVRYR